jgi:glucose dehydrogenase
MRFAFLLLAGGLLSAQNEKIKPGDWPRYNRDLGGTRYSPLTQITPRNVGTLKLAWKYLLRTEAERKAPAAGFGYSEISPIVVNGVMYMTAGARVLALDPDTGKEIWVYEQKQGRPSNRGVTYWPGDANNSPRIIFTAGQKMIGLNAKTGKLDPGFGKEGEVDLAVPYNSPPTIYKNLLIAGANVPEQPEKGPSGNTRAYDARTGAKLWEFHSVPHEGEVGNDTWPKDHWQDRTGANHWGITMTVDEPRGILYTVYGSPASDYYGFDREGDNLFGNSIVALDAATGKRLWHFQTVHHDLWDMDLPPAPVLLDITVQGKKIPALVQTGKLGLVFILNRVTGEPVFGVEERPVPQSEVPGEHTSRTQPFPLRPPMLGRHSFRMEDLVTAADTTEAHAKACQELVVKSGGTLINHGPYTPWAYRAPGAPPRTAVNFPGDIGGMDWGGLAADPKLGYAFINTSDYGSLGWIEKMPDNSRVPYDRRSVYGAPVPSKFWDRRTDAKGTLLGGSSWPCQKPPWGHLTAVNANTGELAWEIVFGVTDELPEGKKNTGRINVGGPITTASGLLFIGATTDKRFHAFDSKTGKLLWETKLDYDAIATPLTYLGKNGKQYVAISASGGVAVTDPNPANTEAVWVFALP